MKGVPPPKYRLALLGRFELSRTDGPVELPNKKLAALLAYLACTAPEPQSREKLATLLWGSHFETQARQNLRQALFRLRRVLGEDALIGDGEEISLAPGLVDCDVARREALIRDGSRTSLAAAVDLYKGRFLSDVSIPEEAWADWVAGERQRLEGSALDALVRLGEIELAAGHADKALETAHRALAINNLREDAHRLIIQALAAAGRKAEALKHYQDLVALLKRELSTEPDAATKSLVADLGSTQPPSGSPAVREIAKPALVKSALPQPDRPSIAVPPFADTRGSPEREVNAESHLVAGDAASVRMKVLVVDDHALIRQATHAVLKLLDRKTVVFEASSSHQAIQIVEKHPDIGLILLDIKLPDRDGFSVLGELRDRYPAIAIIILSASNDQDEVKRAFSLGALGFIPKTTEQGVMLNAIELVLSGGLYIPSAVLDREGPNAGNPAVRGEEASSAAAVRSGSRERRQLTIMVCNLVGSAPLSARLDPEVMHDLIATFHKMAADVVARFDGFVARYLGDGVHVYFGYPAAHEHDAEHAVRAGLAILDAVGTLKSASNVTPQARVGIATGLVVVGEQPGTGGTQQPVAIGETPTLAARLQAAASPGEIVIAASTRRLVGRMFDCRALGANEVKGQQPVEAWQVRGETVGVSRFEALRAGALSPLVGRQEEIDRLLRRWDQAKAGEGRLVMLSGEPGIGKSRIAESLLARIEGKPHALVRYFCSPHHAHSPLYPFIAQLEGAASFEPGSDASAKLDKLAALLKPTSRNVPRDLALIADLLSVPADERYPALALSPQQKREMTLTALLDQLEGAAANSPSLIVLEDVHWIDPTSLDLLDRMVARVANLPVLLVITFRPEFQPTWVGLPHVTMLPLSRLGRRDGAGIIDGITRDKALPDEVVEQILAHADGVPLFIEELTKSILESSELKEAADRYEYASTTRSITIPATLRDSLMARLDRYMPVKEIAQIGAAIGREFSYELIAAVAPRAKAELEDSLERLTASGLAFRRGTPPEATYTFKHALVQDAAYDSLLKSRRQELHRKIARAIEERFPGIKTTEPEVLAHHLTAARLAEAAIPLWRTAGELSMRRAALAEAISHLTRGLEVISTLPPSSERDASELELRTLLGAALIATRGFAAPEVEQAYGRARVLCRQMGDTPRIFPVLYGLWAFYLVRADMPTARELVEQLLQLARSAQDQGLLLLAHRAMGTTFHFLGEFVLAHEHNAQGIALYDPQQHSSLAPLYGEHPAVACHFFAAHGLWCLGYPDRALVSIQDALTLARQIAHPVTLVEVLDFAAWVHQCRGEEQLTREQAEAAVALATEHKIAFFLAHATILVGWALVEQGQTTEGIAQIRQGLAAHRATGAVVPLPSVILAEAYGKVGQPEEGLLVVAEAQAEVHKGLRYYEAELYRLKGELLLGLSTKNQAEAETCFHQALDIARRQQARSLELRAAVSLGRLWQRHGKRDAAHELLAAIYGWFSEGFETADLREAKVLLETLA